MANPSDAGNQEVPYFFVAPFPENEWGAAWSIRTLLMYMDFLTTDFQAALELFDYCERNIKQAFAVRDADAVSRLRGMIFVPARDGAMSIFHFGKAMRSIRQRLHRCPSMRACVSTDTLRIAVKRFNSFFPQIDKLRHAVAHAAEEIAKLGEPLNGGPSVKFNNLMGRTFETTIDGQEVCYSIETATLKSLRSVKAEFYSAFRAVEAETMKALETGRTL